jgi:hypothetical protein
MSGKKSATNKTFLGGCFCAWNKGEHEQKELARIDDIIKDSVRVVFFAQKILEILSMNQKSFRAPPVRGKK